jgi:hypothetical protein
MRLKDSHDWMLLSIKSTLNKPEGISEAFKERLLYARQVVEEFRDADNTRVISGNVFSPTTWRNLYSDMEERGINSFDLITAKPEGAFAREYVEKKGMKFEDYSQQYQTLFLRLLNRTYKVLSSQGGVLVAQVPHFAYSDLVKLMNQSLATSKIEFFHTDITSRRNHSGILIRKGTDSIGSLEELIN